MFKMNLFLMGYELTLTACCHTRTIKATHPFINVAFIN